MKSTFVNQSLHIGHLNIHHLRNKVADLSVLLSQPTPFHVFGVTESRLNSSVNDATVSVSDFSILRRDPCKAQQTGIAVYVHYSILPFSRRRTDLESENVESVWVEIKAHKSKPLLVGFVYRNPASLFEWYDHFVTMLDKVTSCGADVLLLGDFNINLLAPPPPAWDSTVTMLGLSQLITEPTRVTVTTKTLLDHVYTNNRSKVSSTAVLRVGFSDHDAVACQWASKVYIEGKGQHKTIFYRSMKNFNKDAFFADLYVTPFSNVSAYDNPDEALSEWYRLFLGVLDRHAPLREKRVKQEKFPQWLNRDIIEAMALRDSLKRDKDFVAFKQQRNKVRYLIREAQKKHFHKLMQNKSDTYTVWKAINAFTKSPVHAPSTPLSAETFNKHFLSAADSVLGLNTFADHVPAGSEKLKGFVPRN